MHKLLKTKEMKKLSFKLLLMLLGVMALNVAFTACDDDDDDFSKKDILGKWVLEKYTTDGVVELPDYECETKIDYSEFLADGRIKDVYYDKDCKEDTDMSQWNLDGNTLMLQEKTEKNNYIYIYTVKKLTSETMVLLFDKELKNGKEEPFDDENKDGKKDEVIIYLKRMK